MNRRAGMSVALVLGWVACADFAGMSDTGTVTPGGANGAGPQPEPLPEPQPLLVTPRAPAGGSSVPPDMSGVRRDGGVVKPLDDLGPPGPTPADAGAATAVSADASVISGRTVRYVRLVADSEVSGGSIDSTTEQAVRIPD